MAIQTIHQFANIAASIFDDISSKDVVMLLKWTAYMIGAFVSGILAVKRYAKPILDAILSKVTNVDNAVNHGRMERLEEDYGVLKSNQGKMFDAIDKVNATVTRLDVAAENMQLAREVDLNHRAKLEAKLDLLLEVHGVQQTPADA